MNKQTYNQPIKSVKKYIRQDNECCQIVNFFSQKECFQKMTPNNNFLTQKMFKTNFSFLQSSKTYFKNLFN